MRVSRPSAGHFDPLIGMQIYIGRFAPTPSGALHFGSLVAALGSWLDARSAEGLWLLRIDDLDTPRVKPGAESKILRQLHEHGLNWDAPIRRQSEHVGEYESALTRLRSQGRLYACQCTRAQLAAAATVEDDESTEPPYPGTCRDLGLPDSGAALRFRTPDPSGRGDFVVRRRDGRPSYQLACAVDEAAQGITDVVRGSDLASSAMRQIQLMHALDLPVPRYRHLPLVLDASGRKLGKRNESRPLEGAGAQANLVAALTVLGQEVPPGAGTLDLAALLHASARAWNPDRIPASPHKNA